MLTHVPQYSDTYAVTGVTTNAADANAMADATGVRFTELPLSPPRVLEQLSRGV